MLKYISIRIGFSNLVGTSGLEWILGVRGTRRDGTKQRVLTGL